jgi:hypothetical protein
MTALTWLLLTAALLLGALSLMLALRLISLQRFAQAVAGGALGLAAWTLPLLLDAAHD